MKKSNNTILITGGTSGIGREMVRQFYQLQNTLIVVSSDQRNLADLQKEFSLVKTIQCDLSNSESVKELIETCIQKFPELNVLINNAGIQHNYNWISERNHPMKIRHEIATNLTSPMELMYGLLPMLLDKSESAIVNISSALIYAPKKSAPIYCATKAGIHNATKSIRYQLEGSSVKVFEIIPPVVDTKMTTDRNKGKISPEKVVKKFILHFQKNRYETRIGKAQLLYFIHRISPRLADRILKNG